MPTITPLYVIGLTVAVLFIIFNIDDLVWDLITLRNRRRHRDLAHLDLAALDTVPPKLLAVVIPVWDNGHLLKDAIDNMIKTIHYPTSMYHLFIGIHPNDQHAIEASTKVSAQYLNTHVVVNPLPGPTTKAENLNFIISRMRTYQEIQGIDFGGLIIHDTEDIVHPSELKVTNYLLELHDILQFPVFPLQEMPRPGNYFKNLTVGTYADEFAEKCYSTIINRHYTGAFVPSVGAGFALSRDMLESFDGKDMFSPDDASDGYQFSLALTQRRVYVYFVLEQVTRLRANGDLVKEFIATRTRYPAQVSVAIRQRARSIFGITMQSLRFRDVFTLKNLSFAQRYSLYRDRKAKGNNFLILLGYIALLYWLLEMFLPLPAIYPLGSISWFLCWAIALLMLEQQIHRAIALANIYGARSTFIACFLPPVFSIRAIWGSIINALATAQAWRYNFILSFDQINKARSKAYRRSIEWSRTQQEFVTERVLQRFHRNLGDVLLEKGSVTAEQLTQALRKTQDTEQTIGNHLLENGIITEEQLLAALSHIKHVQYLEVSDPQAFVLPELAKHFDRALLEELVVVPLLKTDTGFVFAFSDSSPYNAQTILREKYHITINAVLATQEKIELALHCLYNSENTAPPARSYILKQYEAGKINYEQAIIAYNYLQATGWTEEEVLVRMGLNPHNQRQRSKQLEQVDVIFDELITHTIETLQNKD